MRTQPVHTQPSNSDPVTVAKAPVIWAESNDLLASPCC